MAATAKTRSVRRRTSSVIVAPRRPGRQEQPETLASIAKALGPILIAAFAIRLLGLSFGAGQHPDERHTVGVVNSLQWTDLNPHSFAYGSFPFYCLFLINQALAPFLGGGYDLLFTRGRVASALMGTIGIAGSYFLARSLNYSRHIAWWSAALLAVTFFHVQNSHFFTVDVWLTTLCTLSLIAILNLLDSDERPHAVIAGALVGLATATKISALSLGLPVVAALAFRSWQRKEWATARAWKPAGWLFLAFVFAFIVAEPYALLDCRRVIGDLQEQMNMASGRSIRPFTMQYLHTQPWLYPLQQIWLYAMGWPLAAVSFGGVLLALRLQWLRFQVREAIVLLWSVVFFLVIGFEHTKFPRYLLPCYPVLVLFGARALFFLEAKLEKWRSRYLPTLPSSWVQTPRWAVFAYSFVFTIAHLAPYGAPLTTVTANHWIGHYYATGGTTVFEPWDDTLPYGYPEKLFPATGAMPLYEPETPQRLETIVKQLSAAKIMALPTARVYGSVMNAPERLPQTARYYQLLFAGNLGYHFVRSFKLYPRFGPFEWNDDLADESITVYSNPKVLIFENMEKLSVDVLRDRILHATVDESWTKERMLRLHDDWN